MRVGVGCHQVRFGAYNLEAVLALARNDRLLYHQVACQATRGR